MHHDIWWRSSPFRSNFFVSSWRVCGNDGRAKATSARGLLIRGGLLIGDTRRVFLSFGDHLENVLDDRRCRTCNGGDDSVKPTGSLLAILHLVAVALWTSAFDSRDGSKKYLLDGSGRRSRDGSGRRSERCICVDRTYFYYVVWCVSLLWWFFFVSPLRVMTVGRLHALLFVVLDGILCNYVVSTRDHK